MSANTSENSDVKKAADNADAGKIEKNLNQNKKVDEPENLSDEQKTPYIEEDLRTDK